MSGRAVSYSTLRAATLAGVGPGADLSTAWDQLFFDSFNIAVSQTAAFTIEASGYIAGSKALPVETGSNSLIQTGAVLLETKAPIAQTGVADLESGGSLAQTAQPRLEARGYVNAALSVIKIEAGGAASIPQTAQLRIEILHGRHSYYPAPKSYCEAYKQHYVAGEIPVESKGITITQQAELPLAATEDPAGVAVMTIELRPHDVTNSLDLALESRFGIATRRWLLIESPGGTPSTGQGEIPFEIGGTTPANDQIVPLESNAPRVTRTQTIPVEQRFIAVHGVGNANAESRGFLSAPQTMAIEIDRKGTVVPLPAGAEDVLTIVRKAAESLIVKEALPLSES